MAEDTGESAFLERAREAFDSGLQLVQVREKGWPRERQRAFVERMLRLAQSYGAKVLLNGDADIARAWGCAGVHWTARELMQATGRPHDLMCGASCHDAREIEQASALGIDFAVLAPVLPTPTHPDARPLAWDGFAQAMRESAVPVFALGGLDRSDLDTAMDHGAHGVAMRRAAW
jgi:8-oxo-dGTP diphosphatase